jgi:hypothetical protein
MTNSTARCDHIVALIDACLAEVEATQQKSPVTFPNPSNIASALAVAGQR